MLPSGHPRGDACGTDLRGGPHGAGSLRSVAGSSGSPIVEILGYTGTAIALVGTGAVVGSFTSGGRVVTLLVSLLLAVALFLAGFVLGASRLDRLDRMRSVLWFLSVGAFQAFVGALIEPSSKGGFFLVLVITAVAAGALWFALRRTPAAAGAVRDGARRDPRVGGAGRRVRPVRVPRIR